MLAPADAALAARSHRKRAARVAVAVLTTALLLAAIAARRDELAVSVSLLGRLDWTWIAAAIALETVSMGAFSELQRRLLLAGGVRVTARPMLATTYAANALSVTVPLAGPELGTAYTYRRITRQGADAVLASWSLLAGGVISAAAAGLVLAGGGAGLRPPPVRCDRRGGRCARRRGGADDERGRPSATAAPRAGTRRGVGAGARPQAAAPARRGSPPGRPGLRRPPRFPAADASGLAGRDRPGFGQPARRRRCPRGEYSCRRRPGAVAPAPGRLRGGPRRAERQHHPRRARGHRGSFERGPRRRWGAGQPVTGRGPAVPPGQLLAGCRGRVADLALAAPPHRPAHHRQRHGRRPWGSRPARWHHHGGRNRSR